MAAPVLQAEGATATGVTTGVPSITIPTHQANDILVVAAIFWGPNTAGDAAQIPTPAGGWALLGSQVGQPAAANRDGWLAWFWLRASGAGTTVTLTRGASWDTGTDTCYNGRAYVIRNCKTSGNPYESAVNAGPYTTGNQAFPAVTVSGVERTVIIFGNVTDNLAFAMTSTGWTTGTEDNDNGGTDSSFQTARKVNIEASTSADTGTVTAPAAGAYGYVGVSFVPQNQVQVATSNTITITAPTGSTRIATRTADAGTNTVTITSPDATLVAGGANETLAAGPNTTTITAPSATAVAVRVAPAGTNTVTTTSPTATVAATRTAPAGVQAVTFTAPAATIVAEGGDSILEALANTILITAPTAIRSALTTILATAPSVTTTAPTATRIAGGTTKAAGPATVTLTAPTATIHIPGEAGDVMGWSAMMVRGFAPFSWSWWKELGI